MLTFSGLCHRFEAPLAARTSSVEHITRLCHFEAWPRRDLIIRLLIVPARLHHCRSPQAARRTFPATVYSLPFPFSDRFASIDGAIGGGLPKSAITELSSSEVSAGSALLLYALLAEARSAMAIFSPWSTDGIHSILNRLETGVCVNLLWVRCTTGARRSQSRRSPSARWQFPPGRSRSRPEYFR